MSPKISGIADCDQHRSLALVEAALAFAEEVLGRGGHFVAKVFKGPAEGPLFRRVEGLFGRAQWVKPEASRASSSEIYLVGLGFRGR